MAALSFASKKSFSASRLTTAISLSMNFVSSTSLLSWLVELQNFSLKTLLISIFLSTYYAAPALTSIRTIAQVYNLHICTHKPPRKCFWHVYIIWSSRDPYFLINRAVLKSARNEQIVVKNNNTTIKLFLERILKKVVVLITKTFSWILSSRTKLNL